MKNAIIIITFWNWIGSKKNCIFSNTIFSKVVPKVETHGKYKNLIIN